MTLSSTATATNQSKSTNNNDANNDSNVDNTNNVIDLVLIGGGHAHVYVLKHIMHDVLANQNNEKHETTTRIQCTLLTRDVQTPYSGMLPGFVAGHYTYDQIHINLKTLCCPPQQQQQRQEQSSKNHNYNHIKLIHGSATKITYNNNHNSESGGYVYYQTHHCHEKQPQRDEYYRLKYDVLSIDIGSTPSGTPPQYVTPVKPISNFAQQYQILKEKLRTHVHFYTPDNPFILVIVGGGAGGIELAMSAQYNIQQELFQLFANTTAAPTKKRVTLAFVESIFKTIIVTKGTTLLPQHNSNVRRIMERILNERNIQLHTNIEVIDVQQPKEAHNTENDPAIKQQQMQSPSPPSSSHQPLLKKQLIYVQNQQENDTNNDRSPVILFDECLWCTSAGAAKWLSDQTPFDTTSATEGGGNFIKVKDTYECINHPGVFAVGDCCHFVSNPRPKAGVFAVRAGPPLYRNLRTYIQYKLENKQERGQNKIEKENENECSSTSTNSACCVVLETHTPQTNFLGLISTGDKYAIASRGSWFAMEGRLMWKWKDYIDRAWMKQYQM